MRVFFALLLLFLSCISVKLAAEPVDLSRENTKPIGKHIAYFIEPLQPLSITKAIEVFKSSGIQKSDRSSLNFGIGSQQVWLKFVVKNSRDTALMRRLSIETSWLDNVDVYFVDDDNQTRFFKAGDRQPFLQRAIISRFFQFDHQFKSGLTSVYMRVETPDPMVLPIYLMGIEANYQRQTLNGYSYGFLYGGIFVLLAYNLMLFASLKNSRYLYYSIYLSFFILVNLSYTGHGYQYFWPNSPQWQLWANPLLMLLYSISGLMFALRFLNIKFYFPRAYGAVMYSSIGALLLEIIFMISSNHYASLILAFSFMFVFSLTMPVLGSMACYVGNKSAKYFLIASVIYSVASCLTVIVVWNFIPYSVYAYRAIDIGMMLDAILLAMALAYQFRLANEEKLQAEKLAHVDPLTQIYNRRAFHEFVSPLWSNSIRNHRDVSIMIMDLDRFKLINDTYGHAEGDKVLKAVAEVLKNNMRTGDILARWGGEEFIVFLPETNNYAAVQLANRFCQAVENIQLCAENKNISLTISVGVANNELPGQSLEKLISVADHYLYEAKSQGRNRVVSR